MDKPRTHTLADVLAAGYVETDTPPCSAMCGLGFLRRHRAHCAIRLSDGLWHCFRYADPIKAEQMDLAMRGPLL